MNVLITGGNSGIGRAVAADLATQGANVTITSRSEQRGLDAANEIEAETGARPRVLVLNLADLEQVEDAAARFTEAHDTLDVLVNNAGGIFGSRRRTTDGFETTIGTNYLGPFALTLHLLPLIESGNGGRIVNVASSAHGSADEGMWLDDLNGDTRRYKMFDFYAHSKLANILHARELDRRFSRRKIRAFSAHPGVVKTALGQNGDAFLPGLLTRFGGRWLRTASEGADTVSWLASSDHSPEPPGGYFEDRQEARSTNHARNDALAADLWKSTEALLADHIEARL